MYRTSKRRVGAHPEAITATRPRHRKGVRGRNFATICKDFGRFVRGKMVPQNRNFGERKP
jgi:hypothetical protein